MRSRYFAPLLIAVAALAQTPAERKPAVVEGTVFNSVTGEPLRKVELSLANGQIPQEIAAMMEQIRPGSMSPDTEVATATLAATTDTNGKFRFEQVAPGTYWLTAKKAGFGDGKYPVNGAGSRQSGLRLASGQELKGVEIRLVPNGTISGRVLDEDGEPFPTALVSAMSYRYEHGHKRLAPADMVQTNAKGEFSLGKLPPGSYIICADVQRIGLGVKPPAPPADGSPEMAYVGTYYPATVESSQAQKIDVAAGAELTGFGITLQKAAVVRVKGKLTDANGQPIKSAQLMTIGGGGRIGSMSMSMVSDPEGKFELTNLQPGSYTVMTVQMLGGSPKMSMQPLAVPAKGLDNVTLGSQPDATVSGKVAIDGDSKQDLKSISITLTSAEGTAVMPVYGRADETGAFTLEHVMSAPYDLTLPYMPEGTYLKSVMFNDREKLGQALDFTGITSGTLRIVLGTDGGQVQARVLSDSKPAPKATVVLLPADPNRRFPEAVRTGSSDQNGSVTLKDVLPGSYLAFAWEKIEGDSWYDPDFVKTVQSKAASVKIGSKEKQDVQLELIPAAK